MAVFTRIYYFFIGIIMSICLTLDIPMRAIGPQLDLTGYELVFEDEFEGDALDTDAWFYRQEGLPDGVHNAASQVSVSDGLL